MKERNLTCIVCPRGCNLKITFDEAGGIKEITGNACKRGIAYAEAECTHPTRTVTSTVRTEGGTVIPVKTNAPIPKELIFEAMKVINKATVASDAKIGDVAVKDILGTGVDVVVTANVKDYE